MRFKKDAIKPDTVIFCRRKEDEQELLKYLKSQGYATDGVPIFENSYLCPWEDKDGKNVGWSGCEDKSRVVNFSDLIEPDDSPTDSDTDSPMSAVKVLRWLRDNDRCDEMDSLFGSVYVEDVLEKVAPEKIVEKIAAYEAAKAEKKVAEPVEVEKYYMLVVYDRIGNFVKRKPVYGDNPDIEDEVKSLIFPLTGEKYDVKVETRYRRVMP